MAAIITTANGTQYGSGLTVNIVGRAKNDLTAAQEYAAHCVGCIGLDRARQSALDELKETDISEQDKLDIAEELAWMDTIVDVRMIDEVVA